MQRSSYSGGALVKKSVVLGGGARRSVSRFLEAGTGSAAAFRPGNRPAALLPTLVQPHTCRGRPSVTMKAMTSLQWICVFCGSNPGARPDYAEAARALAHELCARGLGLVYGGASVGVMAAVADAVLARGGRVIGVIPQALLARELAHPALTELHVVGTMHERKARMVDLSDGFVALPGGYGTLDELFEVMTWAQLGLHEKPCGLLDVADYFAHLVRFIDHTVAERMVRAEHRELLIRERDPAALLDAMAAYTPPRLTKWIDRQDT
jgi:uncharacterized protein (TIGR00730 family)